ncbi:hypothetical protein GQ607_014262 [Colletotrichum asianum]|uniref:Uncharacterized protein n=1 Tax=Colletotrichum asianum TaxID=702518 RepID=A0A8H3W0S9_9PEZI|nr:hypothetical protein GQ607_014262 [Colletotrichum asianum]
MIWNKTKFKKLMPGTPTANSSTTTVGTIRTTISMPSMTTCRLRVGGRGQKSMNRPFN